MNRHSLPTMPILLLAALCLVVSGCGATASDPSRLTTAEAPATPTPSPLPPTATPEPPPADETAWVFLEAWQEGDHLAMYDLLSPTSWDEYPEDQFVGIYQDVAAEATILGVEPRILAAFQPNTHAEIVFEVIYQTALVGELRAQNQMFLSFEDGRWGVDWSPALIFPQMTDQTTVHMTISTPPRGNIYDRNGLGLAVEGAMVEVGVVPGEMEDEAALLNQLRSILGVSKADLKASYANARIDWYVPVGQITPETAEAHYATLREIPGVELRESFARSYRPGKIAPHVVGIVGPIPAEEVDLWRTQGYRDDELVGRMGLERWGESYLAGERGALLEILGPYGEQVALLAERPARENKSLYTTFDREFQKRVQEILGDQRGAIAVLEARTGRVLALATYPSFDPNLFATGIAAQQWQNLQSNADRPLVNRATQGTYAAGSVFKIVTTIAGMEVAGLTPNSEFVCRGIWTGLGKKYPKTCWAKSGHGSIPLHKALTVSCDITYYQVGLLLYAENQTALSDYARSCGFGAFSGIEVEESAGLVPDPVWKFETKGEGWAAGDAVNLSIGQGELLVTPLQIASLLAAVGNGGTIYRPQLVEMIASDPTHPESTFKPEAVGKLPIGPKRLAQIRNSLHKVTSASNGTAYEPFKGFTIPVAGKTGTAESGRPKPHAWFAGYAPADDPEIAIAVIVENSGEGSKFAAPLFRKVAKAYFDAKQTP